MPFSSRLCCIALVTAINGAFLGLGCTGVQPSAIQLSLYAPAELVDPYLPKGTPVTPSTGATLTLEQLLIYADNHAPAIQSAKAGLGLANAQIQEAQISFPADPELSLSGGLRSLGANKGFDLEVSIQQQLEFAGEQGLRVKAAEATQRVSKGQINEQRWDVHIKTHRLYIELLLTAERRLQSERFLAFSESLREIARRQIEAGQSPPLILLVADAERAQAQEALIEISALEASLRTQLAGVIGWPTESPPRVQGDLPPIRRAPDGATLLKLMAKHHPSIRRRELAVAAQQRQLNLEKREAWPKPILGINYAREAGFGAEPEAQIWSLSLGLPIPLWRGNWGAQARAEAELLIADRARLETVAQLRSALAQSNIVLNAAVERVQLYATGVVPKLEQNLNMLQRAYELGDVDVHQVSQTRQRLLDAMSQYLDARIAYFSAATTLESLIGVEPWTITERTK